MGRNLLVSILVALLELGCSASGDKKGVEKNPGGTRGAPDVHVMGEETSQTGDTVIDAALPGEIELISEELFGSDADVITYDGESDGEVPDVRWGDETGKDDGQGVVPDVDVKPEVPPQEGEYFVSPELGIKILGPSATGVAQSLGPAIQLAGLVMGKPDAIIWESNTGASGYAQGAPFWLSTKVDLAEGDNVLTVTALKGEEEVTDRIVVTYNPAFLFGGVLTPIPSAIFTNTKSKVCFRLDMSLFSNFDPSTLKLCESTEDGECVSDVMLMHDDGQPDLSCDEYGGDQVFAARKEYKFSQPGRACFRAHVVVKNGYQFYTAYSPVACIEVVQRITQATCEATRAILVEAKQLYNETLATSDSATARQAVVEMLSGKGEVAEVGSSFQGYGVWVRFANGILGALDFNKPGLRGGGEEQQEEQSYGQIDAPLAEQEILVESKRSLVLSPYADELGDLDEAPFIHTLLTKSKCPPYVVEKVKKNEQASLSVLRSMWDHGIVAITGHGDALFKQMSLEAKQGYHWGHMGSQEIVWTGELVDCSKFVQSTDTCTEKTPCPPGSECVVTEASGKGTGYSGVCVDYKQVDLAMGRIAMGPDRFAILPSFVKHYRGKGYPSSIVYLGTCRSLWNGTLGMELFGAGAKAIVGYSGYVSSAFASQKGKEFFAALIEEQRLTGDAIPEANEDPENPGTVLRILGAPNLNATNSDIINPSWETGELTGWQKSGDGRVGKRLGITLPVEGKFMGVISTGMGFTPQTGEIFQTFCIPPDKMELSFYWKFYSEEFKEWCGSIFQDTFEATVEGEDGVVTCVNVTIDDLCPPGECFSCGSQFDALVKSDVVFDQGDVWNTHWKKATCNIMALAGKGPVTLRFFTTDQGDSIYDTVILIDSIKFK